MMAPYFKKVFNVLASFGFAVVILLFLLLLVFLGTLDQVDNGLFYTQQKYFNSLFLVHDFFGVIPVPLPGVYLLLVLFTINLICGGMIRIRKNRYTPGIIIGHVGILVMLAGAFVTFHFSERGNMTLYEKEVSNEFISYHDWAIEIGQPGANDELLIIPQEDFIDLKPSESRTFYSDALPFELTLSGFALNTGPMPVGPVMASRVKSVDGFYLETLPLAKEAERNIAGAYVEVKDKSTSEIQEGILWGFAREPLTMTCGGKSWTLNLGRKRYQVPFTIVLDKFTRRLHPGTGMASSFESEVTKIEESSTEKIKIWMNHPLRDRGYTLFQATWGPEHAGPDDPLYSGFAVVRNPADQWPLYACIIIGVGMLTHFIQKLTRYLKSESKRRTA